MLLLWVPLLVSASSVNKVTLTPWCGSSMRVRVGPATLPPAAAAAAAALSGSLAEKGTSPDPATPSALLLTRHRVLIGSVPNPLLCPEQLQA